MATGSATRNGTRSGKPRRTQEERSAATRRALLDATIEVLVEDGYANLSTTKVAARAGVTRGAQVHHFPTRTALVTEAVQHLTVLCVESMLKEIGKVKAGGDLIGDGLDLLWATFRGPLFQAVFQLGTASAAEPELKESLAILDRVTTGIVRDTIPTVFGEHAARAGFEDVIFTVINTLSGLALNYRVSGRGEAELAQRWLRTKAQLRRLFDDQPPGPAD
jgi:AcrR family transcriptional regulator